jgi:hypothetical protein
MGPKASTTAGNQAGVSSGQTFDPTKAFVALADQYNRSGGVAGRRIRLVVRQIDPTSSSYDSDYAAACQAFTSDNHVDVVLSFDSIYNKILNDCLDSAHIPRLSTGDAAPGRAENAHLLGTRWIGAYSIERRLSALVSGAGTAGALSRGTKLGLVVESCAYNQSAVESILRPALSRLGVEVVKEIDVVCSSGFADASAFASSMGSAVLQFRTSGAQRVMFVSFYEAFLLLLFAQQAESQGYRPGYVLSSLAAPVVAQSSLPSGQLAGLRGVGWIPSFDVAGGYAASTSSERTCLAMLSAGGVQPQTPNDHYAGYSACDAFAILSSALTATRGHSGWQQLPNALGSAAADGSVDAVLGQRVAFDGSREDGPYLARSFQYVAACSCIRYTGQAFHVA